MILLDKEQIIFFNEWSFGFDSDFVVCSTVPLEPVAELDLLEVHPWSVQTSAQLWVRDSSANHRLAQ